MFFDCNLRTDKLKNTFLSIEIPWKFRYENYIDASGGFGDMTRYKTRISTETSNESNPEFVWLTLHESGLDSFGCFFNNSLESHLLLCNRNVSLYTLWNDTDGHVEFVFEYLCKENIRTVHCSISSNDVDLIELMFLQHTHYDLTIKSTSAHSQERSTMSVNVAYNIFTQINEILFDDALISEFRTLDLIDTIIIS